MPTPPRIFLSYSHDSAQHKSWVLDFATTLVNRGVDVVLDQWDLEPGQDLPSFMEKHIGDCDYVIPICTAKYVAKANSLEGGVGYEKMIMTSRVLQNINENKVIPVVREKALNPVPTFLATRLYIDFSNDNQIEYSLDELLRFLLNSPLYVKPEIGSNPYKPLEGARPDRTVDGIRTLMTDVARLFDKTHEQHLTSYILMKNTKLRRLTFDKYLKICVEEKLLRTFYESRTRSTRVYLTEEGLAYLDSHDIVET